MAYGIGSSKETDRKTGPAGQPARMRSASLSVVASHKALPADRQDIQAALNTSTGNEHHRPHRR
ncbi:hypothetical protein [Streptomyces hokutonensis]|uniref:hypothetical protein n=1 Tax=Streptomyces hokutonensis TaxID=1306990 RepID=UPI0036C951BA